MKKTLPQIILILLLFLTACGQSAPVTQTASTSAVEQTATPTFLPTSTQTSIPSLTPTASTPALALGASVTPLPTIPTFTPTFDTSTIVTVTSALKAECPKEDSSLKPSFRFDDNSIDIEQEILNFLNKGGSIQIIINELSKIYPDHPRSNNAYVFTDVTNDEIPDLIFDGFPTSYNDVSPIYHPFYILSCRNGQYTLFSGKDTIGTALFNTIYKIVDMNKNGVPEIIIYNNKCSDTGCFSFFIGEWDGKTFINLASNIGLEGITDSQIQDRNNDGSLELILFGGLYIHEPTWRSEIHTYMWDGIFFVEQPVEYAQPIFRFQSIQDADEAVKVGKYDNPFWLYEETISKKILDWWSAERQKIEQEKIDYYWAGEPTPDATLTEDKTEYPRLAAYAYYRIMLLQFVQNQESEATTTYNTLQEKFGNDRYAHPYMEMATAFWKAYQSTHKMYDGCAAVIQYAAEHPEILTPLGSDYHGSQSHTYVPADICPFR